MHFASDQSFQNQPCIVLFAIAEIIFTHFSQPINGVRKRIRTSHFRRFFVNKIWYIEFDTPLSPAGAMIYLTSDDPHYHDHVIDFSFLLIYRANRVRVLFLATKTENPWDARSDHNISFQIVCNAVSNTTVSNSQPDVS